MDFNEAIKTRQFFKFTGPPEHWLAAIKYGTWALKDKYLDRWKKIKTGDIFIIHSSAGDSSLFHNAKSGVIGFGVVGFDFSINNDLFWYSEIKNNEKIWPLCVPITEFYLFSDMSIPDEWPEIVPGNEEAMSKLIDQLLVNRIPISEIKGFPPMGSIQGVSFETTNQILSINKPLHAYSRHSKRGAISIEKVSELTQINKAEEGLRYTASLRFLNEINKKIVSTPNTIVQRDNDILARADKAHLSVMQQLLDLFKSKGYDTFSNPHVDLFAHNERQSILVEVKSNENKNFRTQARKGIAQLFEYDYFDIAKYKQEKQLNFNTEYKILTFSKEPTDKDYIKFINFLDLGVSIVNEGSLKPVGEDFGFSEI